MAEEAVDPGPWFDRVERSGDGTTDSSELYVVKPKKKTCALCELWFSTDNLTGMTSLKGVLTRKASFGDEDAARRLKDPRTTASRLYSGVPLCRFCAQLARPDPEEDEDDAPAAEADPEDDVVKPSSFLRSFLPEDRQAKYR